MGDVSDGNPQRSLNRNPNPFRVFTRIPCSISRQKRIEIGRGTWGSSLVSRVLRDNIEKKNNIPNCFDLLISKLLNDALVSLLIM